jgi:hypothetical protein
MIHGHRKMVRRWNANSGAQASEDTQKCYAVASRPRDKGDEVLPWPLSTKPGDGYHGYHSLVCDEVYHVNEVALRSKGQYVKHRTTQPWTEIGD